MTFDFYVIIMHTLLDCFHSMNIISLYNYPLPLDNIVPKHHFVCSLAALLCVHALDLLNIQMQRYDIYQGIFPEKLKVILCLSMD